MTSFMTALWYAAGALAMGGFTIVLARRAAEGESSRALALGRLSERYARR